jgi:hypothetical protein
MFTQNNAKNKEYIAKHTKTLLFFAYNCSFLCFKPYPHRSTILILPLQCAAAACGGAHATAAYLIKEKSWLTSQLSHYRVKSL